MVSIEAESIEKFLLLLDHGADPEISNDFNITSLGYAVQHDFIPAIRKLIEKNVDRGYRPKYPQKPLRFDLPVDEMEMPEALLASMKKDDWKSMIQESITSMNRSEEPMPVVPLIRMSIAWRHYVYS